MVKLTANPGYFKGLFAGYGRASRRKGALNGWTFLVLGTCLGLVLHPLLLAQNGSQPDRSSSLRSSLESAAAGYSEKVDALLARMTLQEKIGQMVQFTSSGNVTGPSKQREDLLQEQIRSGKCGNIFNATGVANVRRYQKIAVEETRLKIPLTFGYDVIHGYKTVFPIPLGEASSWDLSAIERSARIAATEAAAGGLNWTFAPMVDIARDPRWGRIAEGSGEDPYLGSQIARARVRGFQGKNLADASTLLACVKHYAAYGAAQAGRDYNTVDMSERTLREVYLPPYGAAIAEGALSVMTSFNELDGRPATANSFLLKRVLREEWGFKGFVVTDYSAILEMVQHGTAANNYDAGRQALAAGVDMDMQGGVYFDYLEKMLANGDITQAQIDTAAKRVLTLKFMLGLMDDPYRYCDEEREKKLIYAPEHLEAAYNVATESMVLLKNEAQTLPLKPGSNIAVIGPLAEAKQDLLGTWSGSGDADRAETVLASIKKNNAGGRVSFAKGCDVISNDRSGFAEAKSAAQDADVVVMVLGETAAMSGEASSRTSINLPGVQTELLREIKKTGKPVIVLLLNGRPLALEEESALADAILEAWHPGTEGGKAAADVLFGKHNPSAKLPVTFPRNLGQVPIFYNTKNTGRPIDPANPKQKFRSNYLDSPNDPLYPFGFGLSYTTFTYSDFELSQRTLKPRAKLTVSVKVSNTGKYDGAEVVQLYIRDLVGSVTRPVLELKGFQRIDLKAGKSRTVSFEVGEKELTFWRGDLTWGTEPGEFQVFIGPNSRDLQSAKFELTKP
jgi:beta-glucosidase